MGARTAVARAFTLHDSDRRDVPLEFSLAAIFSSHTGIVRGGSFAFQVGVGEPGYGGPWTCRLFRCRGVDLRHDWWIRFPPHLDSDWTGCFVVVFRARIARFRISLLDTCRDHVLRLPCHLSLHSNELRSAALQLFSRTP